MPLSGTLSTMPLTELLQWLGSAGKTGTLTVQRDRATRVIRLRDGCVIGSTSDDPKQRIGQFLLSRRKITEQQLREALNRKDESGGLVGRLLVDAGVLSENELQTELRAKAEEVIFSLFDWSDGEFRFEEVLDAREDFVPVNMRVDEVLLRGMERFDEMVRIREVFPDNGIVLGYTSKPPGPEIFGDPTARTMYSAIDGDRSLAEILLHLRGIEYKVKSFFCELLRSGHVEIVGDKEVEEPVPPAVAEAVDTVGPESPEPVVPLDDFDLDLAISTAFGVDPVTATAVAAETPLEPVTVTAVAAETSPEPATVTAVAAEMRPEPASVPIGEELSRATALMTEGKLESALDVLDGLLKTRPGDDGLRRLLAEAEAGFVDKAYRHYLPADQVPILTRPVESLSAETLTPRECFLLSRIDGAWDVKSIVQVAPFREADALRTLKRMREMGVIELRSSDPD